MLEDFIYTYYNSIIDEGVLRQYSPVYSKNKPKPPIPPEPQIEGGGYITNPFETIESITGSSYCTGNFDSVTNIDGYGYITDSFETLTVINGYEYLTSVFDSVNLITGSSYNS